MIQLTDEIKNKIYEKQQNKKEINYRLITKRESLLFMGFKEDEINNLLNNSQQSISKI
jgi:Holliday junction resolvasome RuvABC DNA-binding subunit